MKLKSYADKKGLNLQFRSADYKSIRTNNEKPLAFICHDTRDKEKVALTIAINLKKMMCPVWYDEFSLNIGDNLRESIEKGLKECHKCILILTPNFISNNGWTKKEFDSIFTREILEENKFVLPVWYQVDRTQVYEFCPSLLNIKGVIWGEMGEEACRRLYRAITD